MMWADSGSESTPSPEDDHGAVTGFSTVAPEKGVPEKGVGCTLQLKKVASRRRMVSSYLVPRCVNCHVQSIYDECTTKRSSIIIKIQSGNWLVPSLGTS